MKTALAALVLLCSANALANPQVELIEDTVMLVRDVRTGATRTVTRVKGCREGDMLVEGNCFKAPKIVRDALKASGKVSAGGSR